MLRSISDRRAWLLIVPAPPALAYLLAASGWLPDGPTINSYGSKDVANIVSYATLAILFLWIASYTIIAMRIVRGGEIRLALRIALAASVWFTLWLPALYLTRSLNALSVVQFIASQSRWSYILLGLGAFALVAEAITRRRAGSVDASSPNDQEHS